MKLELESRLSKQLEETKEEQKQTWYFQDQYKKMKKDQVQQQKEIQKIKQINETYRSQLNNWESKHQAYMDKANLNEEMLRNTINNL